MSSNAESVRYSVAATPPIVVARSVFRRELLLHRWSSSVRDRKRCFPFLVLRRPTRNLNTPYETMTMVILLGFRYECPGTRSVLDFYGIFSRSDVRTRFHLVIVEHHVHRNFFLH